MVETMVMILWMLWSWWSVLYFSRGETVGALAVF